MHVLVNALSVTNQSGRHVLLGHLSQLAASSLDQHRFTVLHHETNADLVRDLGANVAWRGCPSWTAGWLRRTLWESLSLPRVVRRLRADCVFSPAGVAVAGLPCPQVVLCQNPWCLLPFTQRTASEKLKGRLQRRAYGQAVVTADVLVFNSLFMRDAYLANAAREPKRSLIAYQGLNDDTFAAAERLGSAASRERFRVISVSAMAPHKDVGTAIRAVASARVRFGIPMELHLVGVWPDPRYRAEMESLSAGLGVSESVVFRGCLPLGELHRAYAEARVFCLMSRCESFGIPAVEAQCFGTPVVSSSCCAIPEVCGAGGVYPEPGDYLRTGEELAWLLSDDRRWQEMSRRASANAARFHWNACTRPLLGVFSGQLRGAPGL